MTNKEIEFTIKPKTEDVSFITQKINEEISEFGPAYPFAFFMRAEDRNIIAGCNGSVFFGCIYTDQLWVHREYRKQGLGKQLMEAVHEHGRKAGCRMATISTMSFQNTRKFYEKLGYSMTFEYKGYARGSSCLLMKKDL